MFKQCVVLPACMCVLGGCMAAHTSAGTSTLTGIAGTSSANVGIIEGSEGFGRKQNEQCEDETSTVAVDEGTAIINGQSCTLASVN